MSGKVVELYSQRPAPEDAESRRVLHVGRPYALENNVHGPVPATHGLIGGYRLSLQTAEIFPVIEDGQRLRGIVWDPDATLAPTLKPIDPESKLPLDDYTVRGNSIDLTGSTVDGPKLLETEETTTLVLDARFELCFRTPSCDASLGMIHLVEAQRFAVLGDGSRVVLLDTQGQEAPVLYLDDADADQPVRWLAKHQTSGAEQAYSHVLRLNQDIPEYRNDHTVESVTVLEQFTSYAVQRELGAVSDAAIWTPGCPPIRWGWSIRVERRVDRSWCIARRKLMLPILGHDGLELPVWTANSLGCLG